MSQNCQHSSDGWCLDCVEKLQSEILMLKNIILELDLHEGAEGWSRDLAIRVDKVLEKQNARK